MGLRCARCAFLYAASFAASWGTTPETDGQGSDPRCIQLVKAPKAPPALNNHRQPVRTHDNNQLEIPGTIPLERCNGLLFTVAEEPEEETEEEEPAPAPTPRARAAARR